jgi:structural maintenance of chromosome 2
MLDSEQAALASLQAQLAELNQEELDARVAAATAARDEAAAGLQSAEHGVEAATRELAGRCERHMLHLVNFIVRCWAGRLTAAPAATGVSVPTPCDVTPAVHLCAACIYTGAETGDGRDESNRSLQERLADAQNAQTAADAEAKAADIKQKHLTKQAAEQRKALASKDKEGAAMRQQLDKAQQQVARCTQALQVRLFTRWSHCRALCNVNFKGVQQEGML